MKTIISRSTCVLNKQVFFLLLTGMVSCHGGGDRSFMDIVSDARSPEIRYENINVETVILDSVNCSYYGFSDIDPAGHICYYDRYFGYLYEFDSEGKYLSRHLGIGRSNQETTFRDCVNAAFSDRNFVLLSSGLDFEIFDSDYSLEKRFTLVYRPDIRGDASSFETYSFSFDNRVARIKDGIFYIGMMSEHPEFNCFTTGEKFLERGRHIGRIDLTEEKPLPMIVEGFPRIYHSDRASCSSFSGVNFDIGEDCLYVGYEADSLIFRCSLTGEPESCFGISGRGMDMDYEPVRSLDDMPVYRRNRETKGWYGWIEYIDETGILFRTYVKGQNSGTDGLQVYKDGILIADVDVPKGFRVVGYMEPYYYSQVFEDEENGRLEIMRFRL